ncbi:helix-turn-helix domain-containing protein [Enterococcus sp. AZ007]|uniref:helix-turn-helix domain-containing protein n=1 Tax=Enterococcus sp. AZ007 TaxID=2774839 RepID=UPI003F25905C
MNRLRELREKKGFSLKELGEELGMSAAVLGNYERGNREPKLETWSKLAEYFKVSVGYVSGITDSKNDLTLFDANGLSEQNQTALKNISDFLADLIKEENPEISLRASELMDNIADIFFYSDTVLGHYSNIDFLVNASKLIRGLNLGTFFQQEDRKNITKEEAIKKYFRERNRLTDQLDTIFINEMNENQIK